jgi:hypothetical protein
VIYRVKFSAAAVTNVLTDSLAQLVLKAFRQYFIKLGQFLKKTNSNIF